MKKSKFEISDFVGAKSLEEILFDLVEREKMARKSQKITQRELARKSGVSYGSIRRFETTGEISLRGLMDIAKTLGCLSDFNLLFGTKPISDLKEFFYEDD